MWPTDVPVTRDGYQESTPDRVLRSDMDVGPAKVRRRSSSAVKPVKIQLYLNDTQLESFDEFYDQYDSLAFDFVNPRTEETVRARFTQAPSYDLDETMWRVNVNLEILP